MTVYGIPLTGHEYSSAGWYFASPSIVTTTVTFNGTDPTGKTLTQRAYANSPVVQGTDNIDEGVGTGFYYAPDGGGAAYIPFNPNTDPSPAAKTDNTVAMLTGAVEPAVETVFNGNFEQGLAVSPLWHIVNPTLPWGRFPASYQLPGWSFQGGSGFTLGTDITLPFSAGTIPASTDITGLFVVPEASSDAVQAVLDGYITQSVKAIVGSIESAFLLKVPGDFLTPSLPANATPAQTAAYDAEYGNASTSDIQVQTNDAQKIIDSINGLLVALAGKGLPGLSVIDGQAAIGGLTLATIFKPNAEHLFNQDSIKTFTNFLTSQVNAIIQQSLPQSQSGVLFGGSTALQTALTSALDLVIQAVSPDAATAAAFQAFSAAIVNSALNLPNTSTLTHDRLYVPTADSTLNFHVYAPVAVTPGTSITVTIALDDNGQITPGVDPTTFVPNGATQFTQQTFQIYGGFFKDFAFSMPITAYQGHQVVISFHENNGDSFLITPGDSGATFTGTPSTTDILSSLFILEDVSLSTDTTANDYITAAGATDSDPDGSTDTADGGNQQVGVPGPAISGSPVGNLTIAEVSQVARQAEANWVNSGLVPNAAAAMANVGINLGVLTSGDIGTYSGGTITIDPSADGVGWYTGLDNSEFAAGPNGTMTALSGSQAAGEFDLLTVLEHEYGHALGIADLPGNGLPGALMDTTLTTGVRIMPSAADLTVPPVLTAPVVASARRHGGAALNSTPFGTPSGTTASSSAGTAVPAGPLANGNFNVTDPAAANFGWTSTGTVTVAPGAATLTESRTQLASLSQTFTLDSNETTLSFTVLSGQLFQDNGQAPDAFEVSLLNSAAGTSVLGSLGLSRTTDLFNLQANGTVFLAPGVTVTGLNGNGKLDLSAGEFTVTIDVSQVPRGENLSLHFNLTTFGDHNAFITLADVGSGLSAGPIAVGDSATVTEGASRLIDVLANDGGTGLTLTSVTQPQQGTAVIQNGKVFYTAPANYAGADSFTYTETDSNNLTATATVHITVRQIQIPTGATIDTATVVEGHAVLINVLANDTGSGLTLTSITTPTHGTAVIQNGEIKYTAANGFVGADTFNYTVNGTGGPSSAAVNVTVTAAAAPVANPDTASVLQNGSVLIDVLAGNTGLNLVLTSVTAPQFGAAAIENGKIRYTPSLGYTGADSFNYTETDINGQTASNSVGITVLSSVIAPGAVAQTGTVQQGGAVLIDVLANDTGTGITLTGVTAPAQGTAVIQNGEVLYTAPASFVGTDTFSYTITGATGLTATGSVTVTVNSIIVAPAPAADSATVVEGNPVVIDLLAIDVGTGRTLTSACTPAHGTAVIQNGKIIYTAANAFTGPDTFTYGVTGGSGLTGTGSVSVTVTAAAAPVGTGDTASLLQDTSVLIDVLANDTGLGLTLTSVAAPSNGTAVIQSGKILYTPSAGYFGADSFSYTATDINGQTETSNVAVTVVSTAVPPNPVDDTATVAAGASVLIDVLANDTGTGLTLTAVGAPLHGTAVIQNGRVLYTAPSTYVGPDSFSYNVVGQTGLTGSGAVGVTITETAPVANPDTGTLVAGASLLVDVLANDSGSGLTLTSVVQPAHGTAAIQGGKILYTAASNYAGADTVSYGLTDAVGETASGTLTLTITPPAAATNIAPTVFSPALDVPENAGATAIGIPAPTDPNAPATALTVVITALPVNGIVTLSSSTPVTAGETITVAQLTTLLFTPATGVFGDVSGLTYSVSDPGGNAATGTATLSVGPASGAPVASQPSLSVAPGAPPTAIGIAAPTDPNFPVGVLTVVVQALPSNGTVTLADGTPLVGAGQVLTPGQLTGLLFTPASGTVAGNSSFNYGVTDPAGNTVSGSVAIGVGPVTATPTFGFEPPAGGAPVPLAITDEAQPVFEGLAAPNAGIAFTGVPGTATADGSGAFSYSPAVGSADVTGLNVSVTASATATGLPASAPGITASVFMLPTANANGVVQTDLSSLDIATDLNAGYSLQMTPGTEAINLVDGVLSVGPDTNEAFIQRLYVGLLGRSYDAGGMEFWDLQMAQGGSAAEIAEGFLTSAEYEGRPQPADEMAFITSLYQGFLGRAPDPGGMTYWTSAPVQAMGQAWIVSAFDQTAESKTVNAFATSMVFARSAAGTALHDIYESTLNREVELSGLFFWEGLGATDSMSQIANLIAVQPETIGDHGGETDSQFVIDLYTRGTGLAPASGQLDTTLTSLESGMSRGDLMLQIATSPAAEAFLTSDNFGQPPVLAAVSPIIVATGQPVSTTLAASDPDRTAVTYGLVGGPSGATVDPSTGVFSWAGSRTPTQTVVTVDATNAAGLVGHRSFVIDVEAAGPSLLATGPGSAIAGTNTFVSLSQVGTPAMPGDTVTSWIVNWGDGSALQTVSEATAINGIVDVSHDYATPGSYQVNASALTSGFGTFEAAPVAVSVTPDTLSATSVSAETTGFHARFNGVLDPATVTVLPDAAGDAPSIIVTGPGGGTVAGSIVVDPDGAGFTFVAASGALADGAYQVVIRGVVKDMRGRALDGTGGGTPGVDLTTGFSVHNDADTLSAPAFMVGPGQTVNAPATASTGLPVSFTSDGTATSVVFTVAFTSALLAITGATAAAGLPAGATVGFVTTTLADGLTQATITVQSPTALPAGTAALVDLTASVPATAAYGVTEVLGFNIVSVNGVAQALPETAGLQVVGYLGDANGDGSYSAADGTLILRVVGGADSGFAAWSGIAPAVISGLDGGSAVDAADAALVGTVGPAIPGGITLVLNAPTPFVSAPTSLTAAAGGTVTVPVTLDQSVALTNATITLRYDQNALTLTAVRADPSSGLTVVANPASGGLVTVTVSQTSATAVSGVLALFDFQVAGGVQPGTNLALDLSAVTVDGRSLNSVAGADGTDGRILVTPDPPVVLLSAPTEAGVAVPASSPTRAAQAQFLSGEAA